MAIVDASSLLKPLYPSLTWQIETAEKYVYLTFDDGPHPEITREVLDILRSFGFRGTFFTVGQNMERYPEMCERILEEGHVLGNHTYSHISGYSTSKSDYLADAERWSDRYQTGLFRPPYGRILRKQIHALSTSYRIVMWTLLSWDFQAGLDRDRMLSKMKKGTRPGAIVVFHDSEKASGNMLHMLPRYCSFLKEQGYSSFPIPQV